MMPTCVDRESMLCDLRNGPCLRQPVAVQTRGRCRVLEEKCALEVVETAIGTPRSGQSPADLVASHIQTLQLGKGRAILAPSVRQAAADLVAAGVEGHDVRQISGPLVRQRPCRTPKSVQ